MVSKLARRSPLGEVETQKLLGLPHRVVEFDANGSIAMEGESATHCHVVLSGYAYCHKVTGDGARQIVSIHMRGDILDPCGLALDKAAYNIQTLTRATVASIPRGALMDLAWQYPRIGTALLAEIGVNASLLAAWLVGIGRRDARGRICHLLCEIAARQQDAGICEGPDYEWPMTQEQIADATGLTSVHVNRTLQQLRGEGYFRTARRRLTVHDWSRLREIGDIGSRELPSAMPRTGGVQLQS
jgi:CRP-like cAMP-binding protein